MTNPNSNEEMSQQVAIAHKVDSEIAAIDDLDVAKEKRSQMEALKSYVKAAGKSLEIQNEITKTRLRLEWKLGELLNGLGIGRGANLKKANSSTSCEVLSLAELQITKYQSSRWRKLFSIPNIRFEAFLRKEGDSGKEITTKAVLKLSSEEAKAERRSQVSQAQIPPANVSRGRVIQADMLESLAASAPEFAELIITDPPYGLGDTAEIEFSGRGNMSKSAGSWDNSEVVGNFPSWAAAFRRAIKPRGSLYCFVSDQVMADMVMALRAEAFRVQEILVWRKTNPPPSVRQKYRRSDLEYIIYATMGQALTYNWLGQTNMLKCLQFPICGGKERLDHPTQKPVNLLKELIQVSSNAGDLVLDPFAGVGSTGAAALALDRRYYLIEKDDYYYRQTCIRLQDKIPAAGKVF